MTRSIAPALAAVALSLSVSAPASAQQHGLGAAKSCSVSQGCAPFTPSCTTSTIYADGFGDAIMVWQAYDVFNPGPDQVLVPPDALSMFPLPNPPASLPITAVLGNAIALGPGGTFPVLVGPPGSTYESPLFPGQPLPGAPSPGLVRVISNQYEVADASVDPLPAETVFVWRDQCDSGAPDCDPVTFNMATVTTQIDVVQASITVFEEADVDQVCEGDPTLVTYTFTVTNGGDANLENVMIGDPQCEGGIVGPAGDVAGDGILALAEAFLDLNMNGMWDLGEPFLDANGNEQWDDDEVWTYTCTSTVDQETTSIVTVTASAVDSPECVTQDQDEFTVIADTPPCEITGPVALCEGAGLEIYAGPAGVAAYDWSIAGDAVIAGPADLQTVLVLVDGPGSFTLFLNTTSDAGCMSSCSFDVTINPLPQADPQVVGDTCDMAMLCANPSGGTPPYAFVWSGPGGFSASTECVQVTQSGIYCVLVVDAAGCAIQECLPVTVSEGPVVSVSSMEICAGNTAQLCADIMGGQAPYTFSWTGPGGFMADTQCVDVGEPGDYCVVVTDSNGCPAMACGTLIVDEPPLVTVDDTAICAGEQAELCAAASGGSPPYVFFWTGPSGFSADTECITVSVAGTYTVVVTDVNGCQGTDSGALTVNPNPLVAVNDAAVCDGDPGQLCANASGGTPPYTYSWTGPGGFTATTECITVSVAGTYTVVVTDANGCAGTDSGTLTVSPLPTGAVNDAAVCAGDAGQLCANASGGTPPYTYSWTGPGGFTAMTECITVSVAGTYTVLVTDANGCTGTDGGTLTAYPNPTAAVNDDATCAGTPAQLCANASGGSAPYAYSWTGPAGFTADTECISVIVPGTYCVTVTDMNGCTDQACGEVIDLQPAIAFSMTPLTPFVCEGSPTEVEYLYALSNFGNVALENVIINDDQCDPVMFLGGDADGDGELDTTETWFYSCSTIIVQETVSTAFASANAVGHPECEVGVVYQAMVAGVPPPVVDAFDVITCDGSPIPFCANVMGGTPPYAFVWSGPGGFVSFEECPEVVESGEYCVVVTDANGCEGSGCGTVEISPPLFCEIEPPSPFPACGSGGNGLTVQVDGGTAPYTFSWSVFGSGWQITAGQGTDTITYQAGSGGSMGTFFVEVQDAIGCATMCQASIPCDDVPVGACCVPAASCVEVTEGGCATLGGIFLGEDTVCGDPPCVGACCLAEGGCTETTASDCSFAGGFYQGDGVSCASNPCPAPGACCLDGGCTYLIQTACGAMGGVFKGANLPCSPGRCPSPGTVLAEQKISDTAGGFGGTLFDSDRFGSSVAAIGDLDGDGVDDVAVGAPFFVIGDGPGAEGSIWIILLNADGTVKSELQIGAGLGGFGGMISSGDEFGAAVAAVGDLNGDGTVDLAVGAPGDSGGGTGRGAIWILFLNPDGTVQGQQRINDVEGGFGGILDNDDGFGSSLGAPGDLNGDGVPDLAVGTPGDDDAGPGPSVNLGAVWILFLEPGGTVLGEQKISQTEGGFGGALSPLDRFGASVAAIGDLDGDAVIDLAVGADGAGSGRGAVWILFMNADGTVHAQTEIGDGQGGFGGVLDDFDRFGAAVAAIRDLDGDGVVDVAVGATGDDDADLSFAPGGPAGPADGSDGRGAVWVLFLHADGTVKSHSKISDTQGNFGGTLSGNDQFGSAIASVRDLDGDGVRDLAVGAFLDDDGGVPPFANRGAVWILFIDGAGDIAFGEPTEYEADGAPFKAAVGDLDTANPPPGMPATGTLDVAVLIPDVNPTLPGAVQVFLNQGTIGDEWQGLDPQLPTFPVGPDPTDLALGLFNNDLYLDVAVTNQGDGTVTLLFNAADDTGEFVLGGVLTGFDQPSAIAAADLVGTGGFTDLAVTNRGDNTVVILENDGNGNFTPLDGAFIGVPVGMGPISIDPIDVDNDKDIDLASNGADADSSTIIINEGGGSFTAIIDLPLGHMPSDGTTGDFDRNGFTDIASSNRGDGTATIVPNNGPVLGTGGMPSFGTPITLLVGSQPLSIAAADFDADGDLDLAVVAVNLLEGPSVQVLENVLETGTFAFEPPVAVNVLATPQFVVTGDLDGNHVADIVTANVDDGPTGGSVTAVLSAPVIQCATDFDADGETGFADLLQLLGNWGRCTNQIVCPGDIDGNGEVGFADLLQLLGSWGTCQLE